MSPLATCIEVFRSFFRVGWKMRRTRWFLLFRLIPALVMVVFKALDMTGVMAIQIDDFLGKFMMIFYFQMLLPLVALLLGTAVIGDELEGRTLVYLLTLPVPRPLILLGKWLAHMSLGMIIIGSGYTITHLIAGIDRLGQITTWVQLIHYLGVALLALLAYGSLFTALSSFMRKSILLGLFFVFGWESWVQFLPGITQKFTLVHHIKSLLPPVAEQSSFLVFKLDPSSSFEAAVTLLTVIVLTTTIATLLFSRREYILSDSE